MDYSHLISYLLFLFFFMSSPGPSFALIARSSIKFGLKGGIFTSFGIVACDALFIFFAVIGVAGFLNHYPKALEIGKIIGSIYIFYIGVDIFLSTFKKAHEDDLPSAKNSDSLSRLFLQGFFTNAANPLAIVGMLAITLTFFHFEAAAFELKFLYTALVPLTSAYVYCGIALIFGNSLTRKFIVPYVKWFERFAGIAICTLALMMIFN